VYPEGVAVCATDGTALGGSPQPSGWAAVGDSGGLAVAVSPRAIPAAAAAEPTASEPTASESAVFDPMIGATLAGRYRIVRRIGEGGMGAVYEAVHTIIGKRLAVKVLLEKFLTKTDFVARLLQEARLASAIGHEHIVDVTDFGTTDDGRAFVAMEFLDGESLAELVMREAPLPVERSLRIARQVASALGAAHAKGIVHRDIKPENVYLIRRGDDDFVKVVDFGISKAVKQGQGLGDDVPDYRLTHTGLLLGTPLYMSPEQARGEEELDHRVDIWALGVMLYECLTGEVPFRANNYLGIISQVLTHAARPPSQLRPELGIPEAVESVVMHAMEKDRTRRYATMAEVEHDLERLLAGDQNVGAPVAAVPAVAGGSISPTPPPLSNPGGGRAWIWTAAFLALVAGVIATLRHPREPEGAAEAQAHARPSYEPSSEPSSGTVAATPGPAAGMTAPASRASATATPVAAPGAPSGVTRPGPGVGRVAAPPGGHASGAASLGEPRPTRSTAAAELDNRWRSSRVNRSHPMADHANPASPSRTSRAPGDKLPAESDSTGSEAALRGALPSRSGEGYPENE
jgi:serine/threonine-protein kinase